jgi:predicted permease
MSLVSAIVFGLAPALQASKSDVVAALKDDSQGWSGRAWLRSLFVVAQVAFSLVLVIVAGLFVRALQQAGSTDPGFNPRDVELAALNLSVAGYTDATGARFTRNLVDRVRRLPGVRSATVAQVMPGGFEGIGLGGITAPGFTPPNGQRFLFPAWNVVGPGYFATLQIPLVAGRDFTDTDGPGAQQVAIVGESLARRLWPGETAIGKFLSHGVFEPGGKSHVDPVLVVGVARDIKTSSLIDGLAEPFVYLALDQHYSSNVIVAARSVAGRRVADDIRSAVSALNPTLPITNSQTLEESTALGLVPQRVAGSLAGTLGLVGLMLAAIGIYGVMAYVVARRTREFGIRLALGAPRAAIVGMILRQGIGLAAIGAAAGFLLAAGAARILAAFFFGHPPFDPLVFGGAAVLFTIVALGACAGPSRRALGIDPLRVLRYE